MSDIKRIVKLAQILEVQTEIVARLTEELTHAKEAMLVTEREDLPMLMSEVGLTEFTMDSGRTIKVVEDCTCALTDATRERGVTWLIDHGFGGLVKTSVELTFGRGERDEAEKLGEELREQHPDVIVNANVHHSTLKSFVKEQLEKGSEIPMDLFNVFPYSKAVIK